MEELVTESQTKFRHPQPSPALDEIDLWLKWAGEKLLSLPLPKPGPAAPGVCWPNFPSDASTAYGYSNIKLRPVAPLKDEIKFIDEILDLILLIDSIQIRRIMHARCLIAPNSGKQLYSWTRIGKLLSLDRKRVAYLHRQGLTAIAQKLPPDQLKRIRDFVELRT